MDAHVGLGAVLLTQGRFGEAIVCERRALELDPNEPWAHVNLGAALLAQGRLEEAIAAFHQALALPNVQGMPASTHTLAHTNLGYVLQLQGKLEEAIEEYGYALQLDANFIPAQNALREAERLLGGQSFPDD